MGSILTSSTIIYLLTLLAAFPSSTSATPWLHGRTIPQALGAMFMERSCANPCGYYGQVCCSSSQVCQTVNDEAVCGEAQATAQAQNNGQWEMFTTTIVETETDLTTIISTYSSLISVQTTQVLVATAAATATCQYGLYESPCGSTCCAGGESCINNVCVAVGGGSSGLYSSFFTVTTGTASSPLRPTSATVITITSTGGVITTTQPFTTPKATDGSSLISTTQTSGGGLSGGAIAGIVIGVIAGIILLLLICACCCFKGLIDGLLGIFGLGPRRRRVTEETIITERHHHSGASAAAGGRTWFGSRPSRIQTTERKSGFGFGGLAGIGAALAAMAVILGLKRRHDRKHEEKSSYGSSYYDSEYTSSSSASSDRRTRDSHRSRDSRRSRR